MSDSRRQYRTVRNFLNQFFPDQPQGNLARHLNTLAGLISGIVASKRTNLPQIAEHVPDGKQLNSRVKRFTRFISNENIQEDVYFAPYVRALLESLAFAPLTLVIDVSGVGRNCVVLMLSVVYKKRALPVGFLVRKGKKGHQPEEVHLALLEKVSPLIPPDAQVILLGDGEFDGTQFLSQVRAYGWDYVCRTAKNVTLTQVGTESFPIDSLQVEKGSFCQCPNVFVTAQTFGPVHAIAWWDAEYEEPIYLLTSIPDTRKACAWYRKRFSIETFFSDQKSRGFHLHKSHIAHPRRLARLMMAACLAYIWMIHLGVQAIQQDWLSIIHRCDRCDLSLFQLGVRLLRHFLNEALPIPVDFRIPNASADSRAERLAA